MNDELKNLHAEGLHNIVTKANPRVSITAEVAARPNILPKTIDHLLKPHNHWMVREHAINSPQTTTEQLDSLKNDSSHHVRSTVAAHSNTSKETLQHLGQDPEWNVRYSVSCNRNTPMETLEKLSHDRVESIGIAAHNTIRDLKHPPENEYKKWMDT